MDAATPPRESQSLLEQGEQLLDSSRQLLADMDDALTRDAGGENSGDTTPGLDTELAT